MPKTLFYFSATQAGDWWPVGRGHVFMRGATPYVVTGFNNERREVYISHDCDHRVVTHRIELFDTCHMMFRETKERE